MNNRAQRLLRNALALAPDERADIAAGLLASLDEPPAEDPAEVQAGWAKEIERRAHRVLAGESAGEPWDEVREQITRRLGAPGTSPATYRRSEWGISSVVLVANRSHAPKRHAGNAATDSAARAHQGACCSRGRYSAWCKQYVVDGIQSLTYQSF